MKKDRTQQKDAPQNEKEKNICWNTTNVKEYTNSQYINFIIISYFPVLINELFHIIVVSSIL